MTADPPSHSRWLIRDSIDVLAASHDAASDAVATLTRAALLQNVAQAGPTAVQRIAGRRGVLRTVWLAVMALITASFMAWISVRLMQHLSAMPGAVAALPGLLLALALVGATVQANGFGESSSESTTPGALLPWTLLAVTVAGCVTWTTLWLALTARTATWAASAAAAALVGSITAGMLTCTRLSAPAATAVVHRANRVPRRLRAQRRRAQRRLRDHTRRWNLAAHQYGVTIAGSREAAEAFGRILADDASVALDGIDPFDVLILRALRDYRPSPLAAGLHAAARYLRELAVPGGRTTVRSF